MELLAYCTVAASIFASPPRAFRGVPNPSSPVLAKGSVRHCRSKSRLSDAVVVQRNAEHEMASQMGLHALRIMLQRLCLPVSESELVDLYAKLDGNRDGKISWSEFHTFINRRSTNDEGKIVSCLREAARQGRLLDIGDDMVPMSKANTDGGALRRSFEVMSMGVDKDVFLSSKASQYYAKDWIRVVYTWPRSFVMKRIMHPLCVITGWSFALAAIRSIFCRMGIHSFLDISAGFSKTMTFLGSALSLLLVFRTNTAYNRYWEGRKIWEQMCTVSRNLADFCAVYANELGIERVRRIADLLCAFPLALQLYLQGRPLSTNPLGDLRVLARRLRMWPKAQREYLAVGEAAAFDDVADAEEAEVPLATFLAACRNSEIGVEFGFPSDFGKSLALQQLHSLRFGRQRDMKRDVSFKELEAYYNPLVLERLLSNEGHQETMFNLRRTRCAPLVIARALAREVKAVPYDDLGQFTARERSNLLADIARLRGCVTAAERIVQSTVPLHYARHTSRFLSIWCLCFPCALVQQLGFITVLVTAFVVWALFGLREIGLLIENPFRRPLQLQVVSDTIVADVREAIDPIIEGTPRVPPPP